MDCQSPYVSVLYVTYFSSLMGCPNLLFYIYGDDIILGSPTLMGLQDLTTNCLIILKNHNFRVAPDKVQPIPPFKILRVLLSFDTVSPAKLQLLIQETYTLAQLQRHWERQID